MERRSASTESDSSDYYRNRRQRDDRERKEVYRRSRDRSRERYRNRRSRSRSHSRERERNVRRNSCERDLYKDLIDQDYQQEVWNRDRGDRNNMRCRERERYNNSNNGNRKDNKDNRNNYKRNFSPGAGQNAHYDDMYYNENNYSGGDSHDSDSGEQYYSQTPNNKIIVRGLAQHITEADINSDLIQCGLKAVSIRLIRKKKTGASRGFAFVEFSTKEEAMRWMEYKQGVLIIDQYRAIMQYSFLRETPMYDNRSKEKMATDWYCGKCGVFNFKRRENCFKCYASREESEKGGEGSDEISNILTKKIMLRNLDVLTNEESVLCKMQEVVPTLVSKIAKILICRDALTSTSRGICYLHFDNLVDSMNTHNALKALEPLLQIDNREVLISYCMDAENRNMNKNVSHNKTPHHPHSADTQNPSSYANTYQYTLSDVPRLAEYSASIYASNPAEHDHYMKFYTNYYYTQITSGQINNLPTISQLGETANSGAAVAQSAMQRKQFKKNVEPSTSAAPSTSGTSTQMQIPRGDDGKKYPTPDVTQYQYDETSGYYYDPTTGLYYDAHSLYYYNTEINMYLYWDNENKTYVQVNSADNATTTTPSTKKSGNAIAHNEKANDELEKNSNKKEMPNDKVKVAKKIVKDMEKWAKQLNQKKETSYMPIASSSSNSSKAEDTQTQNVKHTDNGSGPSASSNSGYADVGFSILEKKEKAPLISNFVVNPSENVIANKLIPSYGSDSDNDEDNNVANEKDYVDFEKLTCLLCKRAFQSLEILNKHLKMSNLHKDNLQKYNLQKGGSTMSSSSANNSSQSYRDRAKERRLKYGEAEPPVNRSKERFQREIEKQAATYRPPNIASVPIGENNVGNKLLQKMGWSEGQGLGRSNQGRTNIIEAETRVANAGLGSKCSSYGGTGDDYKTYIKRMMKSRYEQADVKD